MIYIPAGFSQVTHVFSLPSSDGAKPMTTTYMVADFPTAALAQYCHETYDTHIWSAFGPVGQNMTETIVRDQISAANYVSLETGGSTNEMSLPQVSLLVKKGTGLIGRPYRGRMYPPGLSYELTWDQSGKMSSGSQEDYQEGFDAWLDALQTGAANGMYLGHSAEIAPTEITSLTVDRVAATQRRRLR